MASRDGGSWFSASEPSQSQAHLSDIRSALREEPQPRQRVTQEVFIGTFGSGLTEQSTGQKCWNRWKWIILLGAACALGAAIGAVVGVVLSKDSADVKEKLWSCESDLIDLPSVALDKKGMTLDDTTFIHCSDRIPQLWPHTNQPVRALRMFTTDSSYDPSWQESKRPEIWANIVKWVHANNAKVLLGTQITCNETVDDADWARAKVLMKQLGRDNILGVAFGNELELLYQKAWVTKECVKRLWVGGYVTRKLKERVDDLDSMPLFKGLPVTTVVGGLALFENQPGIPFFEDPTKALTYSMLKFAYSQWGSRFVFTFNFYPYFDPGNQMDPGSNPPQCKGAIDIARCFTYQTCNTISSIILTRGKMARMNAPESQPLWIGEVGWSWPLATTLPSAMKNCEEFSSEPVFREYYQNFLQWDLSLDNLTHRGPDMVFYFTMRDSINGGFKEHFGLIESCSSEQCKMQKTITPPHTTPPPPPGKRSCDAAPGCKKLHLVGNCCPNDKGQYLGCCGSHPPSPPPPPPPPSPPTGNASCQNPAYPDCKVYGNQLCCPTYNGVYQDCCHHHLAPDVLELDV